MHTFEAMRQIMKSTATLSVNHRLNQSLHFLLLFLFGILLLLLLLLALRRRTAEPWRASTQTAPRLFRGTKAGRGD
jgi:Flp pilus assembly protein protease CpaA